MGQVCAVEVSYPAHDEMTHNVPTLLFFPLFLFAVLLLRREGGLYGANVQLLDLTASLIIVLKETNIYLFPNNITIFQSRLLEIWIAHE